jgi:exosortase
MLGAAVWLLSIGSLYGPVLAKLTRYWRTDPMYSHGFVVAPIALFLVWRQRDRLRAATIAPSNAGLLVLALGLGLFIVGTLGAELFLTRVSLIAVLAGSIAFALGWEYLRLTAFPLAFLIFMIPLPTVIFDRIAVSLQLVASQIGEHLLTAANVPVLRDGNLLRLAGGTLDVNEACSGIRSIVALLMIAALVGYAGSSGVWRRTALIAAAVPLAIVLNGARVAATGLAVSRFGLAAAEGLTHETMGWVVFVAELASVWVVHRALLAIGPGSTIGMTHDVAHTEVA